MPLYDAVKDLTLTIERVELEPHALPLSFMTRRPVVHLHGAGERASARTSPTRGAPSRGRGSRLAASTRSTRSPSSSRMPGYRRWGLESAALDLALRQAGRSLADAVDREPAPGALRRLAAQGAECSRFYPDLLQARRARLVDGRGRGGARRDRGGRRRRPEGAVRGRLGRRDAVGRALRPRRRRLPGRLARGPAAERGDAAGARAAPRPDRGTSRSIRWPTSTRSSSPPRCLNSKPSRFGSCATCSTSTTHAPSAGSRSTAAASSSSAWAEARSSTSPRSSTPTRRTTSRRRSSTRATATGASAEPAPLPARAPGFR